MPPPSKPLRPPVPALGLPTSTDSADSTDSIPAAGSSSFIDISVDAHEDDEQDDETLDNRAWGFLPRRLPSILPSPLSFWPWRGTTATTANSTRFSRGDYQMAPLPVSGGGPRKSVVSPTAHLFADPFAETSGSSSTSNNNKFNNNHNNNLAAMAKYKFCLVLGIAMMLCAFVLVGAITFLRNKTAGFSRDRPAPSSPPPRNVIFMVSDGFGLAGGTLARNFYQRQHQLDVRFLLPLDKIQVGSLRTQSASSLVTDSAAGATAFSCGVKSYNGAIGVNATGHACRSVMELARSQGFLTGVVVTTRLSHATPAAFTAHATSRRQESVIAEQQLFGSAENNFTRPVDLMFGGGQCYFVGKSADAASCRRDERDLLEEAEHRGGWTVAQGRDSFDRLDAANTTLPHLHLFSPDHMSFELDRDPQQEPSLAEMTWKSLEILDAHSFNSKGFFLVVEGSRIDMAAHVNDPGAHLHDILAYNEAVQVVQKFVDTHPGTILISTSDHETGGLSIGYESTPYVDYPYRWKPEALASVRRSTEYTAFEIMHTATKHPPSDEKNPELLLDLAGILVRSLGFAPMQDVLDALPSLSLSNNNTLPPAPPSGFSFSLDHLQNVVRLSQRAIKLDNPPDPQRNHTDEDHQQHTSGSTMIPFNPSLVPGSLLALQYELARMESLGAEVGWSTWGHSAVDVPLYMYGLDAFSLVHSEETAKRNLPADWLSPSASTLTKRGQYSANNYPQLRYRFPLLEKSFTRNGTKIEPPRLDDPKCWPRGQQATERGVPPASPLTLREVLGNHENVEVQKWIAVFLGIEENT